MKKKILRYLAVFGIWLAFSAVVLLIAWPKMRTSWQQSGVPQLMENRRESSSDTRTTYIYLIDRNGKPVRTERQSIKITDRLHDTFEELLAGATEEDLKVGHADFIPKGTTLIGASIGDDVVFVDLSSEILSSPRLDMAYRQLESTAYALNDSIRGFVLLADGKIVDKDTL